MTRILLLALTTLCLCGGCTAYRDFYDNGTKRAEYLSILQDKQAGKFTRTAQGDMTLEGYKSDNSAALEAINKLADKVPASP